MKINMQNIMSQDLIQYIEIIKAGTSALPFMKASCSPTQLAPRVRLPPEMLERVYMYCTMGWLSIQEVRRLYAAGMLLGIEGMSDRQIVHRAVIEGIRFCLSDLRTMLFHAFSHE
tara:strand:- start:325 stop:669 length:345 start_codon:yes stop_codon:yes gene_type:complete